MKCDVIGDAMCTLRELQLALREKIEEVQQRDELIDELEEELVHKDLLIQRLRVELDKYKSIVCSAGTSRAYTRTLNHGVQFKERTKRTAISAESGVFRSADQLQHALYRVAKSSL